MPSFVVFPIGANHGASMSVRFSAIVKSQFGGASVGLTLGSVIHSERELCAGA